MQVPFVDLRSQYEGIRFEVAAAIQRVLEATAFAGGPFVAQFEREFGSFCGTRHAVGVGSGTAALWLSLLALGIGPGDEVITVPNTFIATAEAITYAGAKPVFVDVDEETCLMDPKLLEKALTARTKAIIPVHLYGQMADMDPIMEFAKSRGLSVIEDACQAHGAVYKGQKAGSIGDVGCFSFYPGKNLGAYGEGGAVVTNSDGLARRISVLRDHGQNERYHHQVVGWNERMDGIQGSVLSVKLKYLEGWNRMRRRIARLYSSLLCRVEGAKIPKEAEYGEHVFHLYALRTPSRDQLLKHLAERGISCGIHYPIPIHLQQAYRFLDLPPGSFPVAEKSAREVISLPMFAELRDDQIRHVIRGIRTFYGQARQTDARASASAVA